MFISNNNKYTPSYVANVELMPNIMQEEFPPELVNDKYAYYTQLFGNLDLSNESDYSISVTEGGTGYEVLDIIATMIGGVKVEFIVSDTVAGSVTGVLINNINSYPPLDKSLFKSRITTYEPDEISTGGRGCKIALEINQNKWNTFIMKKNDAFSFDIYGLCRDPYQNLWVLNYNTG